MIRWNMLKFYLGCNVKNAMALTLEEPNINLLRRFIKTKKKREVFVLAKLSIENGQIFDFQHAKSWLLKIISIN